MSKKETSKFINIIFFNSNSDSLKVVIWMGTPPSFLMALQLFIHSSLGRSEYLHPVLGHEDRVLELRGPAVVGADGGPVVLQHPHPGAALAHARLYREGHPREHPARV